VVEVMEAVQLLLSTELFVVVLGLDTRYITRALEKEYKEILQHEGDPSGMDYIEKIIQIPYRVRPIEPQGLAGFVEAQMEFEEVEETPSAAPIDVTLPPMETDDETRMPEEDETIGRRKTEASVVSSLLPPEPLPPEVIRFSREDFADLTACCRQVSLTPRSVKRLINVLKLAKIFWVRKQGHDERRAVKQTVIGLLALSAAYPEIMREAFVRLETGYRDRTKVPEDTVGEFLEGFEPIRAKNSAYDWQVGQFRTDVTALRKVKGALDAPPVDFRGTTLEGLTISTFNLVRSFSFVGDFTYTIER
jgi:hypothetical protein